MLERVDTADTVRLGDNRGRQLGDPLLPRSDTAETEPVLHHAAAARPSSLSLFVVVKIVFWGALVAFFVTNAIVSKPLLPISKQIAVFLAVLSIFGALLFIGAKLAALCIREVIRELKTAEQPRDKLLCLASELDLEEQLAALPKTQEMQTQAADSLVQIITAALKEATDTEELRNLLVQAFLTALRDPELKAGLKGAVIDGLKDEDMHAAAIAGSVQGFAKSLRLPSFGGAAGSGGGSGAARPGT